MAFCGIELPQIPNPQKFKDSETLEHRLLTQKRAFLLTAPPRTLLHICPCPVGVIFPFPPPTHKMMISSSTPLSTTHPHTKHVRHLKLTAMTSKLLTGPTSSLCRLLSTNAHAQVLICRAKLSALSLAQS